MGLPMIRPFCNDINKWIGDVRNTIVELAMCTVVWLSA
jgi:hypothetical protein